MTIFWPLRDVCSALISETDLLPPPRAVWDPTAAFSTPTLKRDRDVRNGTPGPRRLGPPKCKYARHGIKPRNPATHKKTSCPGRILSFFHECRAASQKIHQRSLHVSQSKQDPGTRRPVLNTSSRRPGGGTWGSRRLPRALAPSPVSEGDRSLPSPGTNGICLSRRKTRPPRGVRSINVSYRESPAIVTDRCCDLGQHDV